MTVNCMCIITTHKSKEEFEESVYRRRTDNTMAKRKSTNNDLQNIHMKHEPHLKPGANSGAPNG